MKYISLIIASFFIMLYLWFSIYIINFIYSFPLSSASAIKESFNENNILFCLKQILGVLIFSSLFTFFLGVLLELFQKFFNIGKKYLHVIYGIVFILFTMISVVKLYLFIRNIISFI